VHKTSTILVRVVAAHIACGACGDTARVGLEGDAFYRYNQPVGGFFAAHADPYLHAVEAQIAGGPITLHQVHTH
jgi:hypothetical protein